MITRGDCIDTPLAAQFLRQSTVAQPACFCYAYSKCPHRASHGCRRCLRSAMADGQFSRWPLRKKQRSAKVGASRSFHWLCPLPTMAWHEAGSVFNKHPAPKFLDTSSQLRQHQINQICLENGLAFGRSSFSSSAKLASSRSWYARRRERLRVHAAGKSPPKHASPPVTALLAAFPVPLDSAHKTAYFAIYLTMPDLYPQQPGGSRHSTLW